jgi:hypothetical protein
MRVLDFDLENRPLSYLGSDWTSAEITAIGWSWIGSGEVEVLLLRRDGRYVNNAGKATSARRALGGFREILMGADLVTGHYIRKHDLPLLNSALIELDLQPLGSCLTQDTQQDLVKRKDLSASQENLASMFGMAEAKHHMTQAEWRLANRLSPVGMAAARKRVVDDVVQHMALREEMVRRRLLKAPRTWRP